MNYVKTTFTCITGQKITTRSTYSEIMQLGRMIKYKCINQKHLKSPNWKFNKTENITLLYIDRKRNKIWKSYRYHILTILSLPLPPKTKKLTLTLTTYGTLISYGTATLTHIWKTRSKLQFDDTITIIKNELKNIIY